MSEPIPNSIKAQEEEVLADCARVITAIRSHHEEEKGEIWEKVHKNWLQRHHYDALVAETEYVCATSITPFKPHFLYKSFLVDVK